MDGRPCRRGGGWLAALVVVGAFFAAAPAQASFVSRVSVTSNVLTNGECIDPWCARPNLFARASIVLDDGSQRYCPDGPVTDGFEVVVENQPLCKDVLIEGGFKVKFELWDMDSVGPPMLADQGDLSGRPDRSWTTPFSFYAGLATATTFTTSGGRSSAVFTVTVLPAPTTITLTGGTPLEFDPADGEHVYLAGDLGLPSRLRIWVDIPGGQKEVVSGPFRQRFNVDWDGLDFSGKVLPPGDYPFHVVDLSSDPRFPPVSAAGIVRVLSPITPRLSIQRLDPDTARTATPYTQPWDFWAGPLTVVGFASRPGNVTLTATPGYCGGPPAYASIRTIHHVAPGPGVFALDWDGRDDKGFMAAAGYWCLYLGGTSSANVAYTPAAVTVRIGNRSSGLEVMASMSPIAPALARSVAPMIRAWTVDAAHEDHPAFDFTLIVSAAPLPGNTGTFSPTIVTPGCTRASTCSWKIPPTLAASPALAWTVTVREAPGLPGPAATSATTGVRITDLVPRPNVAVRVDVPAALHDGTVLTAAPVSENIDIVYYPGTGLDPDPENSTGGLRFLYAIEKNVNDIRGYGPRPFRYPSSILRGWGNVAIWAVPEVVPVDISGQYCRWPHFNTVSWAESAGVLHDVSCRDSASGREFSAWIGLNCVGWHELHHAAYNEADEYCCDGGYSDGVNLYSSPSSCDQKGSDRNTCAMIDRRDSMGMILETKPWWRSDVGSDVMVSGSTENADDLRAAAAVFALCMGGGC